MSAATPVTCASSSVSTNQGSSPACAQTDTSCWAPECARVSTPASISSRSEHLPLCSLKTHKRCTESVRVHLVAALFSSSSVKHHELSVLCRYKRMWNRWTSVYGETDLCEHPWTIPMCGQPLPRALHTSVWEVSDTLWKLGCVFKHKHTLTHTFSQLLKYVLVIRV